MACPSTSLAVIPRSNQKESVLEIKGDRLTFITIEAHLACRRDFYNYSTARGQKEGKILMRKMSSKFAVKVTLCECVCDSEIRENFPIRNCKNQY